MLTRKATLSELASLDAELKAVAEELYEDSDFVLGPASFLIELAVVPQMPESEVSRSALRASLPRREDRSDPAAAYLRDDDAGSEKSRPELPGTPSQRKMATLRSKMKAGVKKITRGKNAGSVRRTSGDALPNDAAAVRRGELFFFEVDRLPPGGMLPEPIEQALAVLRHGSLTANDLLTPLSGDMQELRERARRCHSSGEPIDFDERGAIELIKAFLQGMP